MNKKTVKKGLLPYLFIGIFMLGVLFFLNIANQKVNVLTFDSFMKQVKEKNVEEIVITPRSNASVYEISGKMKDYDEDETFFLKAPLAESVMNKIIASEEKYGFKIETVSDPASSTILLFIINVLPMVVLVGVAFFFISRQMGSANKSMDFGRSRARLNEDSKKLTFDNVAGLDEEKEEVSELIDFLKNPKKFQKLGARIPKGVLLVGPPGTGKTLLARAVAGEANVPFYYISGSEFVELFVGVGASRVRDMFKQAKHNAPCLIFIDEIDAVGRQRGAGLGGGHDVLDPALLRPGRFDRQVTVNLPDIKGREEILQVHARNKTFAKNVKLSNIARRTVGFSGADLENLLNEAALLAVRRDKKAITMEEIDEAHDRVLMGPAKKSHKYTEHEKKVVAYHEAGHAVMGIKLDGANEVQKITIVPRGAAGGYNLMLPKEETYLSTKKELLETISGLLGGRVAEEFIFNEITTGAHNDFEKATKIARAMVTEYGMSDLGPVQFEHQDSSVFLGRDYNKSRNFSSQVAYEIDEEQRKIIGECYELTKKVISQNKELLDLIANSLLEKETLTREEIEYLVEHKCLPDEDDEIDMSDFKEVSYKDMNLNELRELAKEKGIKGYSKMTKEELIDQLED